MRKILDEVYMTIDAETDKEWIIRFSSKIYQEKCGIFNSSKLFNDNEKAMYKVGNAHYMFIFEENGRTGTFMALLRDELFAPGKEKEYEEEIEGFRNRILNDEVLLNKQFQVTENGNLIKNL